MDVKNTLYYGDNLDILRRYIADNSVDLVYLDPPFNSNQSYNVLFAEHNGTKAAAQVQAFEDTWEWDAAAARAFQEVVEAGGQVSIALQAFHTLLGSTNMMAYIAMMAPRLNELRRVLKPTGSLYLHCDSTASHYLKILLDAIFGSFAFRNEIIWKRTTTHSDSKTWSRVADVILFYTKGRSFTWNTPREPHSEEYLESKYRYRDADGRVYRLDNMTSPNPRPNMMYDWKGFKAPAKGWRYEKETMERLDDEGRIWYPRLPNGDLDTSKRPQLKRFLDEMSGGGVMGTIWTDISPINSQAQERLGYPTQKPVALLERIITASSNPGDIVLDPFCGCGTAIEAAEKLGRRWIGIDITHLAINLVRHRLQSAFRDRDIFRVVGEPRDLSGAQELAASAPFQFQWWALGLVGARPAEQKAGADKGIDGRLFFHDETGGRTKQIVFSVKGGKVSVPHVRDLVGVMDREKAVIGVLISMQESTRDMRKEAASAGFYASPWGTRHPRVQLLTIAELLSGKRVDYPPTQANVTLKKAPRATASSAGQRRLFEKGEPGR